MSDVAYLELDSCANHIAPGYIIMDHMLLTQDKSLLARPYRPQLGLMRLSCTPPVLTPDYLMHTFWRIDNSRNEGHSVGIQRESRKIVEKAQCA